MKSVVENARSRGGKLKQTMAENARLRARKLKEKCGRQIPKNAAGKLRVEEDLLAMTRWSGARPLGFACGGNGGYHERPVCFRTSLSSRASFRRPGRGPLAGCRPQQHDAGRADVQCEPTTRVL